MTKHDVVRETFKKHFGPVRYNEYASKAKRRFKKRGVASSEAIAAFKATLVELLGEDDASRVTVKAYEGSCHPRHSYLTGSYTNVLYPREWFRRS